MPLPEYTQEILANIRSEIEARKAEILGAKATGNTNAALQLAKAGRNDEFYTLREDIDREVSQYKGYFQGKRVYCNCDSVAWRGNQRKSAFWEYFIDNFKAFGLESLTATWLSEDAVQAVYQGVDMECGRPIISMFPLLWNGDFRSTECCELLKQADVVVTNPPFSLFREYFDQLIEYGKDFLIIGNQNAVTYSNVFPLIQQGKVWMGYGFPGNVGFFQSPYTDKAESSDHREGLIRVSGVCWFTNIDHPKRHEPLELTRKYTPDRYPHYDNYEAIEVSKVQDIPKDYDGVMGVPVTFIYKHCPEQFEIVGTTESEGRGLSNGLWDSCSGVSAPLIDGKKQYKRLFIKRCGHNV